MKLEQLLRIGIDILRSSGVDTPITDAQILLAHSLKIPRWKIITERDMPISEKQISKYINLIKKRAEGIPVAYLTKRKEFFGINLYIDYGVLIPRPETEILVEEVLKRLNKNKHYIGLDIGVGSGAITVALLKNHQKLFMYGVDISDKALHIANINLKLKHISNRAKLIKSNLLKNLPDNILFDFIVSNPPYISINEYKNLSKDVKNEPKEALLGGKYGVSFYKRIILNSKKFLKTGGFLAFEVGYNQSEKVEELLKRNDFKNISKIKDLHGIYRVVIGMV